MPSKSELSQQIIEKAWADSDFKKKLLADPKGAVAEAFGVELPDNINVKVLEETADQYYLVLPQNPKEVEADSQVLWPMWP